ncbi:hypothetical protein [Cupriavidus sp.]|uniref:hypothetical protein n=1 Tax=Cupriavidus sp. TaxID=1873897 RepID=UPI0025C53504|nr:hypothetical protein [Cupriavidus sp.]MCA3185983.1 hypothetical protein [Cupriavidus sp.]MCA3193597.1 hypothetical protein [Cupriavidus sp.]MCA3199987.1 hypothetical protein [Cupriavidus sp.]MCA3202000.1 hypothetical protein [Cupriavidus sp.]
MSAKHTPGPWHRNIRPATKYPVVWSGRNKHVLAIKTIGLTEEEIEANINLAASAPDLLSFAQFVLDGLERGHIKAKPLLGAIDDEADCVEMRSLAEIAREVVAKATGSAA